LRGGGAGGAGRVRGGGAVRDVPAHGRAREPRRPAAAERARRLRLGGRGAAGQSGDRLRPPEHHRPPRLTPAHGHGAGGASGSAFVTLRETRSARPVPRPLVVTVVETGGVRGVGIHRFVVVRWLLVTLIETTGPATRGRPRATVSDPFG